MTPEQVAHETGLSRDAVYRAIRDGELRASKVRRRIVVRRADFDAWLDRHIIEPAEAPVRDHDHRPRSRLSHQGRFAQKLSAAEGGTR